MVEILLVSNMLLGFNLAVLLQTDKTICPLALSKWHIGIYVVCPFSDLLPQLKGSTSLFHFQSYTFANSTNPLKAAFHILQW